MKLFITLFFLLILSSCKQSGELNKIVEDPDQWNVSQCLSEKEVDALIRTILSEKKHCEGYFFNLVKYGHDRIKVAMPGKFNERILEFEGFEMRFVPDRGQDLSRIRLEYFKDCTEGKFEFGDSKYHVWGIFKNQNEGWSVTVTNFIEVD